MNSSNLIVPNEHILLSNIPHLLVDPPSQNVLISKDSIIIQLHTLQSIRTASKAIFKTKYSNEPFKFIKLSKCGRVFLIIYTTQIVYGQILQQSLNIVDVVKLTKPLIDCGFIYQSFEGEKSIPYIFMINANQTVYFYSIYTKDTANFQETGSIITNSNYSIDIFQKQIFLILKPKYDANKFKMIENKIFHNTFSYLSKSPKQAVVYTFFMGDNMIILTEIHTDSSQGGIIKVYHYTSNIFKSKPSLITKFDYPIFDAKNEEGLNNFLKLRHLSIQQSKAAILISQKPNAMRVLCENSEGVIKLINVANPKAKINSIGCLSTSNTLKVYLTNDTGIEIYQSTLPTQRKIQERNLKPISKIINIPSYLQIAENQLRSSRSIITIKSQLSEIPQLDQQSLGSIQPNFERQVTFGSSEKTKKQMINSIQNKEIPKQECLNHSRKKQEAQSKLVQLQKVMFDSDEKKKIQQIKNNINDNVTLSDQTLQKFKKIYQSPLSPTSNLFVNDNKTSQNINNSPIRNSRISDLSSSSASVSQKSQILQYPIQAQNNFGNLPKNQIAAPKSQDIAINNPFKNKDNIKNAFNNPFQNKYNQKPPAIFFQNASMSAQAFNPIANPLPNPSNIFAVKNQQSEKNIFARIPKQQTENKNIQNRKQLNISIQIDQPSKQAYESPRFGSKLGEFPVEYQKKFQTPEVKDLRQPFQKRLTFEKLLDGEINQFRQNVQVRMIDSDKQQDISKTNQIKQSIGVSFENKKTQLKNQEDIIELKSCDIQDYLTNIVWKQQLMGQKKPQDDTKSLHQALVQYKNQIFKIRKQTKHLTKKIHKIIDPEISLFKNLSTCSQDLDMIFFENGLSDQSIQDLYGLKPKISYLKVKSANIGKVLQNKSDGLNSKNKSSLELNTNFQNIQQKRSKVIEKMKMNLQNLKFRIQKFKKSVDDGGNEQQSQKLKKQQLKIYVHPLKHSGLKI